jgi:hypothetical protein
MEYRVESIRWNRVERMVSDVQVVDPPSRRITSVVLIRAIDRIPLPAGSIRHRRIVQQRRVATDIERLNGAVRSLWPLAGNTAPERSVKPDAV